LIPHQYDGPVAEAPSDWDHFATEFGDSAWGYDSTLNYYRKIENWRGSPVPRRISADSRMSSSRPPLSPSPGQRWRRAVAWAVYELLS